MCFLTNKSTRAKIAKTDITCWKRFDPRNISPYQHLHYLKGVIQPSVKLKKVHNEYYDNYEWHINEGYHSYQTKEKAYQCSMYSEKIVECIIPTGTRYYANNFYEEYVSETIMRVK